MHRLWRVVLIGAICLTLAWPALAMAYIRTGDIVEAHPIGHLEDYALDGAAPDSAPGDITVGGTESSELQSTGYETLFIPIPLGEGVLIPLWMIW